MDTRNAQKFAWTERPMDSPMPLLERRRVIGERAMISHVTLRKGWSMPAHEHFNEQFTCVLSGCINFVTGDAKREDAKRISVRAGEVIHLPSNCPHSASVDEDTVVLDIFSPPSEKTGIDSAHS